MKICLVCHKYAVPLDDPCCYPLGFMYVSAMLKKLGHEVKVLNYNLFEYDLEREIEGQDRVLFTGFEEFLLYIVRDAAICKGKGIRTILGGALATFLPNQMIKCVDVVVEGESEEVLQLALDVQGNVTVSGEPPDLSTLPLPDYEGFGIEEYHLRHGYPYMGVLTTRGCPHHCTFCAQTCRFQYRKLADVFAEIDHYHERYGCRRIIFNDNTINVERNRFLALCRGMKEGATWGAAIRADVWDEEMAAEAKAGGCGYVIVGIESFNQARLNRMRKKVKVEQITRTLDLLEKYDIKYSGNVLVGFDEDTYDDVTREVLSIPEKYNHYVFPVLVQPFIGTLDAKTRKLTPREYTHLWNVFREYVEARGKYLYPELAGGEQ